MTSKTAIAISLISSMFLAGTALAVDSNTSGTPGASTSVINRRQITQQKAEKKGKEAENRIMAVREKIASKEAELKLKLQTFKDKKKAEIAERVNTNLNKINQNQTDQMKKHLDKMSTILDKLETRVNNKTPDIKDPAAAKAAIVSARAAIASASSAVTTQAQNDYTVQATTEATIKTAVQTQRQKLYNDLKNVRNLVISAKQAVANAIRVAKSGIIEQGKEEEKEGTTSGKQ